VLALGWLPLRAKSQQPRDISNFFLAGVGWNAGQDRYQCAGMEHGKIDTILLVPA